MDKESAIEKSEKIADDYNGAYNEEDYIDTPPDGGYGWVCCVCVSAMNFATWGANGSFGVMLAFFLENDEFHGASATDYALIVGLLNFFTFGSMSIASVLLFKFGYRPTFIFGITLQLCAYIGASFAKTIGQIQATQGVLLGLSFGIIFGANSIVLPSWFLHKRAIANGFSHLGLGLGGMTFSLVNNALIQKTGDHKWALRALGIINTVICTVTMLLVKIRTPKNSQFKENTTIWDIVKKIYDWRIIKSYPLQLVTLWALLASMSYIICLFSLSNYARSLGYTSNQATLITVLLNLSQGFGRPLTGVLSEIFGRVNVTMFSIMYTLIMVFVFWINLTTYTQLVIFALMLGLFAGISSVAVVPLTVDVVGLNGFPTAISYTNLFVGSSVLVAEIIALDLRDYSLTSHTPYFHCQLFVGSIYVVSFLLLIPYREWRVQRMMAQLQHSDSLDESKLEQYKLLTTRGGVLSWCKRAFYPIKI
uniref:MFS transporter n=1 Tax=Cyberlindnera americana TaxID=36016 RepID=A0A5P8N8Z2_9ASCO|nr:MFS transporter [Cyberlindnera americana]